MLKWIRSKVSGAAGARRLGAQLVKESRFAEAIDVLRRALDLEPHAGTANLLGVTCTLAMRLEEAAHAYAQAIELDPAGADPYLNRAWNACLLGRDDTNALFREWLTRAPAMPHGAPSGKVLLDDVTVCCVDCVNYQLAADALRFTLARCRFAAALYFSDRDWPVDGARRVPIGRVSSSAQYSNFVVRELHAHVDTGYVLVMQYDGFVLNPAAWDPRFLEYDYIGAPMRTRTGYVVGNGGFSLRSRRLLHALRDDPDIRRYDALTGEPLEDVAICRDYRALLEQRHGIRFAPVELAERFSAEHSAPSSAQFGFHNLIHLVGLRAAGFALAAPRGDAGVDIVLGADTELGRFSATRTLDLRSRDRFWSG